MQDENRSKEQLLEESERRLNEAQHIAKIGSWDMNAQTGEGYWSDELFHLFGYDPSEKEASYSLFRDHIHPEDIGKFEESITDYTARVKKVNEIFRYFTTEGEIRFAQSIGNVEFDENGNPQRAFGTFQDITERKQVEERIKESEKKHREILEGLNDVAYRMSLPNGKYEYMSQAARSVFGYDREAFLSNPLLIQKIIHPDSRQYFKDKWNDLEKGIIPKTFDYKITDSHGNERWIFQSNTGIFDAQNKLVAIEGLCRDITEQKKSEEQIKSSLKEKETLLQEIHHRVKNNMQVINSLLRLQASNANDDRIKELLKESQNRIYAMAAVHETLHISEKLSEIDLKSYLQKVANSVFQTYFDSNRSVKLKSNIEESSISINHAYPLGLVINELISNSMKHAFPGDKKGEIRINMRKCDDELELIFSDNGIGMPKGFAWKQSKTLGLRLINDLVEKQLFGSIALDTAKGTQFTVCFNL